REKFAVENWLFAKKDSVKSAEGYGNILNGKVVRILNYPQYPKSIDIRDSTETKLYENAKWGIGAIGSLKFITMVYSRDDYKVRMLECDSERGMCYLNGEKVYAPRAALKCASSQDCGENRVCNDGVCARAEDSCLRHARGKDGWIDMHVYGVDMTDKDLDDLLDVWLGSFFSVSPLKENENLFDIKYKSLGKSSDIGIGNNPGSLQSLPKFLLNCKGDPDITVLISRSKFRSEAIDKYIYLSTMVENKPEKGLVLVHEFGHAFGGLADEYCEKESAASFGESCGGSTGGKTHYGINCVKTLDEARKARTPVDPNIVEAAKASTAYRSCGEECVDISKCNLPVIPSPNSLMNSEQKPPKTFNIISWSRLSKRLNKEESAVSYSSEAVSRGII
ncbi:MAG: M64 family metallopeptidase, partial [Nanoarchaeota archaeon]